MWEAHVAQYGARAGPLPGPSGQQEAGVPGSLVTLAPGPVPALATGCGP